MIPRLTCDAGLHRNLNRFRFPKHSRIGRLDSVEITAVMCGISRIEVAYENPNEAQFTSKSTYERLDGQLHTWTEDVASPNR